MGLTNQQQLFLIIIVLLVLGYFVMKDYKRENVGKGKDIVMFVW